MNLFLFKILPVLLACLYLLTTSAFVWKRKWAMFFFTIAFFLNVSMILMKWSLADAPPLGTIYHLLAVVSLCFFPLYLLMRRYSEFVPLFALLAFAAALPLIGTLFMTPPIEWKRMPILQSTWFIPHVLSYSIAYALALVAVLLSLLGQFKREIESFSKNSHLLILLAFSFLTFGLISGSIWASTSWGTFWAWDPKETWGLITFLIYAIYLHAYKNAYLKPYAPYIQYLAFITLICTCFVVAFTRLGDLSRHAYN